MKDVFVLLNNNIRELFRQTSFWIGLDRSNNCITSFNDMAYHICLS